MKNLKNLNWAVEVLGFKSRPNSPIFLLKHSAVTGITAAIVCLPHPSTSCVEMSTSNVFSLFTNSAVTLVRLSK